MTGSSMPSKTAKQDINVTIHQLHLSCRGAGFHTEGLDINLLIAIEGILDNKDPEEEGRGQREETAFWLVGGNSILRGRNVVDSSYALITIEPIKPSLIPAYPSSVPFSADQQPRGFRMAESHDMWHVDCLHNLYGAWGFHP